jgi:predicted acetyltransferase
MTLRLRPLQLSDKDAAINAHDAMLHEDFTFLTGWRPDDEWAHYVQSRHEIARSTEISDELVPGTLLMAVVNDTLVGRASVRFALNDWLGWHAGHIGYGVLREHRRQGYASEILRQSIIIARAHGVERVLVTCRNDNLASAMVIEKCGGVLERVVPASADDVAFRRYWID